MRVAVALISALLLAGCADLIPPPPLTVTAAFNPEEAFWFSGRGTNAIAGSALTRTLDGQVKTCAGLRVRLQPATAYNRAIMSQMFLSETRGALYPLNRVPQLRGVDSRNASFSREDTCDAQGFFAFNNFPDGDYYLTVSIEYAVPTANRFVAIQEEGSLLMQLVHVAGGETRRVVLS